MPFLYCSEFQPWPTVPPGPTTQAMTTEPTEEMTTEPEPTSEAPTETTVHLVTTVTPEPTTEVPVSTTMRPSTTVRPGKVKHRNQSSEHLLYYHHLLYPTIEALATSSSG